MLHRLLLSATVQPRTNRMSCNRNHGHHKRVNGLRRVPVPRAAAGKPPIWAGSATIRRNPPTAETIAYPVAFSGCLPDSCAQGHTERTRGTAMRIHWQVRALTLPAVAVATVLAVTASGAASGASSGGIGPLLDKWRGWHTFEGVTVQSPGAALTVGSIEAACCKPMTQHWDGSRWAYASPHVADEGALLGVDSLSDTDAWGVGYVYLSGFEHALIEHWHGHRWRGRLRWCPNRQRLPQRRLHDHPE